MRVLPRGVRAIISRVSDRRACVTASGKTLRRSCQLVNPCSHKSFSFFIRLRSHTTLSGISIPADKELPLAFSSGILIGREPPRNRPSFLSYFRRVPSPAEPAHAGPEPAGRLRKPDARAAPFRKKAPVYQPLPSCGASRIANSPLRRALHRRRHSSTHARALLDTPRRRFVHLGLGANP